MNKKILIIEDDVFLGDVLVQKLVKEGFVTELARDGAEGYEKIKSFKPDLILLDIILPSMNGYEILEAKFKDSSISSIPVIIISNSGQPVEISRALSLGVKDYLVKAQFDPEEVMVKVRAELKREGNQETKNNMNHESHISNLDGKKILWVEDDKFLNDIIARKLSSTKCVFFHASEGEEAIALVNKEMPDVVLLDIVLPGMDGFEILKRIKAEPKTKDIPVILLSNLGQDSDLKKGKDLGASRFIVKATASMSGILDEIGVVLSENK